jgi:hypothetical protein
MLDLLLLPLKFWYTLLLIVLIADKIVAMTPVPWDDLIVTGAKKIVEKIQSGIDSAIAYMIVKPIEWFFSRNKKDEE